MKWPALRSPPRTFRRLRQPNGNTAAPHPNGLRAGVVNDASPAAESWPGLRALRAPDAKSAVATAATSPPPFAVPRQSGAVMTLVGKMVVAAAA